MLFLFFIEVLCLWFFFSGKMQHSVWAAELIESASCSSGVVPDTVFPKRVSFRRIWQAKGAKKAASKVIIP